MRWVHVAGASGTSYARGIEVSPTEDVYVAGDYADGAIDLDGDGRMDLPAPAPRGGFIARFDIQGKLRGAWPIAGPEGVMITGMAFAGDDDLLVVGVLPGAADFDGDGRMDVAVRSGGSSSAFLARYSSTGQLRWVHSYAMDGAWDVAVGEGRFALSGFYRGDRDLDEDGTVETHATDQTGESEMAVMLVSDDGHPEIAWTAPGPGNDQARAAIFIPGQPHLAVTGFVQLTADFSGNGERDEGWIRCDARGDLFYARYLLTGLEPSLRERPSDPGRRD
jgi:hypothetical protein